MQTAVLLVGSLPSGCEWLLLPDYTDESTSRGGIRHAVFRYGGAVTAFVRAIETDPVLRDVWRPGASFPPCRRAIRVEAVKCRAREVEAKLDMIPGRCSGARLPLEGAAGRGTIVHG